MITKAVVSFDEEVQSQCLSGPGKGIDLVVADKDAYNPNDPAVKSFTVSVAFGPGHLVQIRQRLGHMGPDGQDCADSIPFRDGLDDALMVDPGIFHGIA